MMKRLTRIAAIALLPATAAFGATLTDIQTEINTQLLTNSIGQITPGVMRGVLTDMAAYSTVFSNSVVNAQAVSYTPVAADCGKLIVASGGLNTITLPAVSGLSTTCQIIVKNDDTRAKKLAGFPSDQPVLLWPQQTIGVKASGGSWEAFHKPGRWRITSPLTVRVNPASGNDANDGLATGSGAFQTLQQAWDTIVAQVDTNNQAVTIQAEDGTYTTGLRAAFQPIGGGSVLVSGNVTTPTNCLIAPTEANSVAFQAAGPVFLSVQGFYLNSTNILTGLYADFNGATIQINGQMNFGTVSGYHMQSSHGFIFVNSSYTISGGAPSGGHLFSAYGGQIEYGGGVTATVTGTPGFFNFARASSLGTIAVTGATFTGAATGARYVSVFNAMIETAGGGANFFPGNASGLASNGGIYD
jgi:hypothetical protein